MKKLTVSLITIMTSLALMSPVYAANEYQNNQQSTSMNQTTLNKDQDSQAISHARSAKDLLGMDIQSQKGEDIGEIQDLKIDTKTGRISYVTIQKGGVLGIGEEEGIPVPLEAFNFSQDKARLLVDQSKLDNAPKQANMNDAEFRRDLDSHYGVSPSWDEGQDRNQPMHMNQGMNKKNKSNQQSNPQ